MEILLPPDLLANSPSRIDGITDDDELRHRSFGAELIQEANILLKLPQVVAITAQNIFHRFYYRKSLKKFDAFTVAQGCCLLASKIEEVPKMLREILCIFHHIYQLRKCLKPKTFDIGGDRYSVWKNELITIERFILKELGFALYNISEHPHKYVLYIVKVLEGNADLSQFAWNYLNDSFRFDICLRYSAQATACAAVYLSARKLGFPLPETADWLLVFGTRIDIVNEICKEIMRIYDLEKVQWLEPLCEVEHLSPAVCAIYDEPKITPYGLSRDKDCLTAMPDTNDVNVSEASEGDPPQRRITQHQSRSRIRSLSRSSNRRRHRSSQSRSKSRSRSRSRNRRSRSSRSRSRHRVHRGRSRSRDRERNHYRRRNRSRSRSSSCGSGKYYRKSDSRR